MGVVLTYHFADMPQTLLCVRKWTTFVLTGSQPSLLRQSMSLPNVANSDVVSVTRQLDWP